MEGIFGGVFLPFFFFLELFCVLFDFFRFGNGKIMGIISVMRIKVGFLR